jgi:ABC-type branched-subunit amino acid transport system substrate-binding protein
LSLAAATDLSVNCNELLKGEEAMKSGQQYWYKLWRVLLVCFLLCCFPTLVFADNVIKFGVINPLTGPASQWGLNVKCTMESLQKFFNDRGGITVKGQKYRIEMFFADDKYTVAGGRTAGEKLIYTEKVDFLVGSFGAEPISGWAPLATKEKKVAVFSGPTLSPKPAWPYLFRVTGSDDERAEALVRLMKEKFECKSVLYIMSDDLVGKIAKESAVKNEKSRGLEVKGYVLVPPGTQDFYPFLSTALKSNPDFLHCKLPPGSMALVVKQARELGYKGKISYPTAMPSNLIKWQEIAGVEASLGFVGMMRSPEESSPLGLENDKYYAEHCPTFKSTDLSHIMGVHIILMAIEKAQSFNPDEICKIIRTTEFHSFHIMPLRAGGEKTYGIKNHITVPVPYSIIVGKGQYKYIGSYKGVTP